MYQVATIQSLTIAGDTGFLPFAEKKPAAVANCAS